MFEIKRQGSVAGIIAQMRDLPERVIPYAAATALIVHWTGRLVAAVDPIRAAARAQARARLVTFDALGSGSHAVTREENSGWFRRWAATPRNAAADTLRDLPALRDHARDLTRNHPLAASAINTNVARAIGTGLAYSPQPHLATLGWSDDQAVEWSTHVQAEFGLWADSPLCDWYGEQCFWDMQDLVLRTLLDSGDAFTLLPDAKATPDMPYRLRLQLLEADRIGNPDGKPDSADVAGGIRRTDAGKECFVYDQHPGAALMRGKRWSGNWVSTTGRSGRRRLLH